MNRPALFVMVPLALPFLTGNLYAGDKPADKPLRIEGVLKADDPRDPVTKNPRQVHTVTLRGGQLYDIRLDAVDKKTLDPFLRVEDAAGKELARDDDDGGFPNARLLFAPPKDGEYKLIATAFEGVGKYLLRVEASAEKIHTVGKDGLKIEGKIDKADPPLALLKGTPPHKAFLVQLDAGQSYVFDLQSKEFDTFLIVQDLAGKVVAFDHDSGKEGNSRLNWMSVAAGTYRICIASVDRNSGAFVLLASVEKLSKMELEQRTLVFMQSAGRKAYKAGKYADAQTAFDEAQKIALRLYPAKDHPDGHPDLAAVRNDLAFILQVQGKLAEAEPLYRDALAMYKRLFKEDHLHVARALDNLGRLLQGKGKLAEAEPLFREALAMSKRLFAADHPDVARNLNNLAFLLKAQGKLTEAEPLYREAVAMTKRLFKEDHPDVATNLNNLAVLLEAQGRMADAELLYRDALAMTKRLFKEDHPSVATGLNNLALLLKAQGRLAEAEPLYRDTLDMSRRLFKKDHPDLARSLNNLGLLLKTQGLLTEAEPLVHDAFKMYSRLFKDDHPEALRTLSNLADIVLAQGKPAEAEPLYRHVLTMSRRRIQAYARQNSEGHTLTLAASLPVYRDCLLAAAGAAKSPPANIYREIWSDKGAVARIYEERRQAARAAAADPDAARLLAELAETRRRRADVLLAPAVKDPATVESREAHLKDLEARIADLDRAVRPRLPAVARAEKLAEATPAELQKLLPADAAVVDFLSYLHMEFDRKKPDGVVEKRTVRYLAFVVTCDRIAWVDLDTTASIGAAVAAWRKAITGGKEVPAAIPAKVRELVWDKVRKELPAGIKTVYICPDSALCRVPWAALPGDKPGTVLLEDFAVATIPHAPFLLDQLWPRDALKSPPAGALVVGGVKYDADSPLVPVGADESGLTGLPLIKPGVKLGWSFLAGTVGEANGVSHAAERKKFSVTRIEGDAATRPAILAALPKAKHSHFATHGFFADPSFRSVFQLDEKDYEKAGWGERIGRSANSPLVMTGLVCAGANHGKTDGRGIITGESLIDLDLSGLELAVLSACETGLGDVAGGEGTFGLQRAFHLAGTRNVVASLWKVPDQPTAALMKLFYDNLWEKDLLPIEALRQAQLEIYRNPSRIAALAKDFRGRFDEVPGGAALPPATAGKSHPLNWAAFTMSGVGR